MRKIENLGVKEDEPDWQECVELEAKGNNEFLSISESKKIKTEKIADQ